MAFVSFAAGFVTGWAVRSTVDSPQELGVKVLDILYSSQQRLSRWFAEERERVADMVAEVKTRNDLNKASAASFTAKEAMP